MNKAIQFLGMAKKAGKLVSGQFGVETAVKSGKAYIVCIASDASDNTKKEFNDMCNFYETEFVEFGTKEELGSILGKDERACIALTDEGFARALKKKLQEQ